MACKRNVVTAAHYLLCSTQCTESGYLCYVSTVSVLRSVTCMVCKRTVVTAGQYNDLATPFMSMPGDTIRAIFSVEGGDSGRKAYSECNGSSPCHFTPQSLGLLCTFYLLLMALASGVAVPGGLFMPSIMVRPCDMQGKLVH